MYADSSMTTQKSEQADIVIQAIEKFSSLIPLNLQEIFICRICGQAMHKNSIFFYLLIVYFSKLPIILFAICDRIYLLHMRRASASAEKFIERWIYMNYKMHLTPEEEEILNGGKGETMAKVMKTVKKAITAAATAKDMTTKTVNITAAVVTMTTRITNASAKKRTRKTNSVFFVLGSVPTNGC